MYDPANIKTVLASILGENSNWKINDSPIDILITSKTVADGKQWYFVKDHAKNSSVTGSFQLIDVAVASASAPTYFKPWNLPTLGNMIDGGVGVVNNPVYQACIEAFYYADYDPNESLVLSLGTGKFYSRKEPKSLLGWMEWSINEFMESPQDQQTEIVERSWPTMKFTRFEPDLMKPVAMDNPTEVAGLYEQAKVLAAKVDWPAILEL